MLKKQEGKLDLILQFTLLLLRMCARLLPDPTDSSIKRVLEEEEV